MTARILLARHASHAELGLRLSGRSEIPLDARGRAEAQALANHLATAPIESIHSSPRRRTYETATAVATTKRLDVRTAPALDEIDFGRFAGRNFAELDNDVDWQRWNADRGTMRCPDGETMTEAVERAMAYLRSLAEVGRSALCVTHCDVIRGVVAVVLGLGFDRMFALECYSASLTTLLFQGDEVRLVSLNEHGWLANA